MKKSNIQMYQVFLCIIIALACLAAFSGGFWYGGWIESLKLRSSLREIPDINNCFISSPF